MKFKIAHFPEQVFKDKLNDYLDRDVSLFVDSFPEKSEELSAINIISIQEPNEYFGLHSKIVENQYLFNLILTWDEYVLRNCRQAVLQPFGCAWMLPTQYERTYNKEFGIAHLCGNLLLSYGHIMRYELLERQNEITIENKKFYHTFGNRHDLNDAREGKATIFGNIQYGIAIENTSHHNYFTEKILDLFLLKTVPIYWGCSNIEKFFNIKGIIRFLSVDHLIEMCNNGIINKYLYEGMQPAIEENYQLAKEYNDYPQDIVNQVIGFIQSNENI